MINEFRDLLPEQHWTMGDVAKYWEDRYKSGGNSGAGSYGEEAFMKAHVINYWITELGIRTLNEIGCGDGNNLLMYKVPISYTGYDISFAAVEKCNQLTKRIPNGLKYYFTNDMNDIDYQADLCLCLDVWYHQVDNALFNELCQLLFVTNEWKYIIIYSNDTNSQFTIEGQPLPTVS